jgi:lysophospholipase L1-like esterase
MRKIRNLLWGLAQRVLLALFGVIVALLLAEIMLRIGFRRQLEVDATNSVVDERLGWRNRPDWQGDHIVEGHIVPVVINPQGFRRSQAVSVEKPPNVRRIILIGDSVTAGFEVPAEKTFAALLEKKLNERGSQKYEVLNAGVRGYGTDQCELWLRREGVKYQPDVVVYVFCHNDLFDNLNKKNKPYYTLQGDQIELHLPNTARLRKAQFVLKNLYLRRLIRRFHDRQRQGDAIVGRMETAEERRRRSEWFHKVRNMDMNTPEWQLMSRLIKRMNATCRQHGAKFYVTSGVVIFEVDDDILHQMGGDRQRDGEDPYRFRERLLTICRPEGIPYVDALHVFAQHYRAHHENLWWKADNHYNEKGHALMAQVLYNALSKDLLGASSAKR